MTNIMTPQQLKNSILQMAIQGKLVEQRPEEGTGEELYHQLQKEKTKLIKEEKIKKQKPLPPITKDEIPFEIPENWKWVRIGNIAILNPKNSISDDVDVSFVPMRLVEDGYVNCHRSEEKKWREVKKGYSHFQNGDIGVAKITPCFQNRKSVIFTGLINGVGAGTTELSIIRILNNACVPEYLLWYFKSEQFIRDGIKSFTGTAGQQRLNKNFLKNYPIALPPIEEQKRIVAKVEGLLPYLDRYEKAYDSLEAYNAKFPDDLKKSILQEAIQGKLVPQDPNDEPASVLLEKIAKEKQRLIKEGKIKKQKPLPPITEDEIPFEIPESWSWARLDDICSKTIKRGKSPKYAITSSTLVFSQKCNTKAGGIALTLAKYLSEDKLDKYSAEEYMKNLDIVVNSTGEGTLGRVGIYRDSDNKQSLNVVPDSHVTIIRVIEKINPFYAYAYLKFYQPYLEKLGTGSTKQTELSANSLKMILFPLPPREEQERIITKIEELLPNLEKLLVITDR